MRKQNALAGQDVAVGLRLREIVEILECDVLCSSDKLDLTVEVGCASDLMSDVLAFSSPGSVLLTGIVNTQAVRTADIAEVRAIVFVRGKKPDPEAVELAKRLGIPLLCTKLFMYEACGRLYVKNLGP